MKKGKLINREFWDYRPHYKIALLGLAMIIFICGPIKAQRIPDRWNYDIELHEKLETLPDLPVGPFVHLGENEILTVNEHSALISTDNGQSWNSFPIINDPEKYTIHARAIQRTESGVVIVAFQNLAERHWTWQDSLHDAPGARLPTYVVRSLDGGHTWEDPKMLHEEWTGSVRDMIITDEGNIVFTTMKMRHNPGRHTVMTYRSEDQGASWQASNIIDLGGIGHHGGVTEATLTELNDGRLMKLIRTNWMEFWRAESKDGGKTWHPLGPSGIPASSAPGILKRLQSGRLLLVWNRPYPEGQDTFPMSGGDRIWSAVPVSNHRRELSIAFSEDDGETWSEPVVIAKAPENQEVSYPLVFEASPGAIWVTTWRGPLRAKFKEKDFVK